MLTYLNFGGFHHSGHGEVVEEWLDPDWDDYDLGRYNPDLAQETYAKAYVEWFNSLFGTQIKFKGVWRPKEYNWQTDAIEVEIGAADADRLKTIAHEEYGAELAAHIGYVTTSRSGYVPFYTAESPEDEPDRLMEVVLDTLLQAAADDWWRYYDEQCLYEMPERVDFEGGTK